MKKGSKSLYEYCQENPDRKHLLDEWDYEKNGELTPATVSYGSAKKVYWLLPYDDPNTGKHFDFEWQSTVCSRTIRSADCPHLDGRIILIGFNDLETTHPEVAAEWHPTKNGDLKPTQVTAGRATKVWWKCRNCGKEWQTKVNSRTTSKSGCPDCCNKNGVSFQELAVYYYLLKIYSDTTHKYTDLGFELDIYIPSVNTAIEYDGSYWHKNKLDVDNRKDQLCKDNNINLIRIRGEGLPQTMLAKNIWIKEHGSKNINEGIVNLLSLLKCSYDFEIDIDKHYKEIYNVKTLKIKENSLALKKPEIAAEWHPTKNGELTPNKFSYRSSVKVWWKCSKCGEEWFAPISSRKSPCCVKCTRSFWSEEEIEVLKKYYSVEGMKVVERFPDRTYDAIKTKVLSLGLTESREWSNEELSILIKYYPIEGIKVTKRLPDRTESGIYGKVNKLGLKYNNPKTWADEEIQILKENYPTTGPKGCEKLLKNKSLKSIKSKASSLGLIYNNPNKWTPEEEENLKKYYPAEEMKVIERFPNRTPKAVKAKIRKLKL